MKHFPANCRYIFSLTKRHAIGDGGGSLKKKKCFTCRALIKKNIYFINLFIKKCLKFKFTKEKEI